MAPNDQPSSLPLQTPNITTAQIAAFVAALSTAAAVVFKFDLSDAQRAGLVTILGTVIPVAWKFADAHIRGKRAQAVAAAAAVAAASVRSALGAGVTIPPLPPLAPISDAAPSKRKPPPG